MATAQTDEARATSGPRRSGARRRTAWVAGILGVLALLIAGGLAVVANRPEIALAAACGLLIVLVVAAVVRARRRARWIIAGVVLLLILVGLVLTSTRFAANGPNSGAALPRQTVEYHGEGHIVGGAVAIDERIVLDDRLMAAIASSTKSTEEPVVQVSGWRDDGVVNGNPAFARTRTEAWDRTSILADTARISLSIGTLSAKAGDGSYSASLAPQNGSRLDVALPKGSVGSAVPSPTARTDALAGVPKETVTFAVDQYDSEVSFDILRAPLRNPAGQAVYEASLWGFWQWAGGVAGAVVSGLVVDKLGQLLWRPVAALFRRRRIPAAPAA